MDKNEMFTYLLLGIMHLRRFIYSFYTDIIIPIINANKRMPHTSRTISQVEDTMRQNEDVVVMESYFVFHSSFSKALFMFLLYVSVDTIGTTHKTRSKSNMVISSG